MVSTGLSSLGYEYINLGNFFLLLIFFEFIYKYKILNLS